MENRIVYTLALVGECFQKESDGNCKYLTLSPNWNDVDWKEIYHNLQKEKLDGILYDIVKHGTQEQCWKTVPDEMLLKEWQYQIMVRGMRQMASHHELLKVIEESKKLDIPIKCFKGAVLADLYPQKNMRFSSDTDILVEEKDFERMSKCLTALGYQSHKQKEHVCEFHYRCGNIYHKIELHTSLWEDFEGEKIAFLNSLGMHADMDHYTCKVDGAEIPTLHPTQHLIYQMFHFVKHYVYEGISLRELLDIVLFSNRYYKEIDWEYVYKTLKELHYEYLLACIYAIGIACMGLHTEVWEIYFEISKIEPTSDKIELFLEDVMRNEKGSEGYWDTIFLVLPYFGNDAKIGGLKILKQQMKKNMSRTICKRTLKFLFQGYSDDFYGDCHYNETFSKEQPIPFGKRYHVAMQFRKTSYENMDRRINKAIKSIKMMRELHLTSE